MLSIPIANTQNGITSAIINVDLNPIIEKNPTDAVTDNRIIIILENPNVNLVFTNEYKLALGSLPPRAKEAYINITKYDMAIVFMSVFED